MFCNLEPPPQQPQSPVVVVQYRDRGMKLSLKPAVEIRLANGENSFKKSRLCQQQLKEASSESFNCATGNHFFPLNVVGSANAKVCHLSVNASMSSIYSIL